MALNLAIKSVAAASIALLVVGCKHNRQADTTAAKPADTVKEAVKEVAKPVSKIETNLALKKSASASSTEYDDHSASRAVDGDDSEASRWCAADGDVPQWLKVDLGKASTVKSVEVTWEFEGKLYLYQIEGSADGQKWNVLADRSTPTLQKSTARTQKVDCPVTADTRYVRVRITSLEEGAWASISELKVMGWSE